MKIFLKQLTGKSAVLDVEADMVVEDFARLAYEKRGGPATFENYLRSVSFMFGFYTLALGKKLSEYGIVLESTVTEVAKSFTMSPGFDWDKLTIEDPITLEDASEPYMLNPGCGHTFDTQTLSRIINDNMDSVARCPLCREAIHYFHIVGFLGL